MPIGANRAGIVSQVRDAIPGSRLSRHEFEGGLSDSWGDRAATWTSNDGNDAQFSTTAAVGDQAVDIDNSNNEGVNLPNYPDSFFEKGTVSIWIDTEKNGYPLWFGNDVSGESRAIRTADGTYEFVGFSNDFDTGVAPSSGFEMATITWDASNSSATFYLNDANEIGSSSSLNGLTSPSSQSNAIGYRRTDSSLHDTLLADDQRTYDKILSATEISNLYNTGRI